MAKIVKNTSIASKTWGGIEIPSLDQYTLQHTDIMRFVSDPTFIQDLEDSVAIINDGDVDLSPINGVFWALGHTPQSIKLIDSNSNEVGITNDGRLKIETQFNYDNIDTDDILEGSTNLYFTNERAQDAIGSALSDTSSIDFTYDDSGNTISAVVLPEGVNHNSLSNLTTGDPHTQYVKGPASATDNAIARYDSTTGKLVKNSNATIDDNGGITTGNFIRPGDTSDTTAGNIRFNNGELQIRQGGQWHVISGVSTVVSATSNTSTTSGTYSVINTMTITPSAGVYFVLFAATAALGDDTTSDISIFTNGVEDDTSTRRMAISANGLLGATANFETSIAITTFVTVNGSQAIDIRFRENGNGTLTVGPRRLTIIPVVR